MMSLKDAILESLKDVDPETASRLAGEIAGLYARAATGENVDDEIRIVAATAANLGAARLEAVRSTVAEFIQRTVQTVVAGLIVA